MTTIMPKTEWRCWTMKVAVTTVIRSQLCVLAALEGRTVEEICNRALEAYVTDAAVAMTIRAADCVPPESTT